MGWSYKKFYSVAQHSYCTALNLPKEHMLAGLLHDASKSYLSDMPSPFKKLIPGYKELENNLMVAISNKFGFEYPLNKMVKEVDRDMLNLELECLFNKNDSLLEILTPQQAEFNFLKLFNQLIEDE